MGGGCRREKGGRREEGVEGMRGNGGVSTSRNTLSLRG